MQNKYNHTIENGAQKDKLMQNRAKQKKTRPNNMLDRLGH
jgi:hypothetical protein